MPIRTSYCNHEPAEGLDDSYEINLGDNVGLVHRTFRSMRFSMTHLLAFGMR